MVVSDYICGNHRNSQKTSTEPKSIGLIVTIVTVKIHAVKPNSNPK